MNQKQKSLIKNTLICVLILSILKISYQEESSIIHKSIHDEYMQDKEIESVDTSIRNWGRTLESNEKKWRKMRVKIDWVASDQWIKSSPQNSEKYRYMKDVFNTVERYFEDRIMVNTSEQINFGPMTNCHGKPWQKQNQNVQSEDLIITIDSSDQESGWFAAAGACRTDQDSGRPIAGIVLLNFRHIENTKINEYYLPKVFIHEVLHIMGFSNHFFDSMQMTKTIRFGNQQMKAIITPKVVAYAKEYFSCDSIEGVPLENGGGSGSKNSHWEKTLFPSEIMNPQVANPATISEFTIALLEDMGWYKGVNAAQRYVY